MDKLSGKRDNAPKEKFDFSEFTLGRIVEIIVIYLFPCMTCMGVGIETNCLPIFYDQTRNSEVIFLNLIFYVLFVFSLVPVITDNLKNRFFGMPRSFAIYMLLIVAYLVSALLTSYFFSEPIQNEDGSWEAQINIIPFILIATPIFLALMIFVFVFLMKPFREALTEKLKEKNTDSALTCISEAIDFAIANNKEVAMSNLSFELDEDGGLAIYSNNGGFKELMDFNKILEGHLVQQGNLSLGKSNFSHSDKAKVLKELNKRYRHR